MTNRGVILMPYSFNSSQSIFGQLYHLYYEIKGALKRHLPRFWWMDRRQRTASNGLARSTMRWCCHCGPGYASACCRSSPTTRLWCLCRRMCTANRLARRWRCSSSRCGPCAWPSTCSWPSSRPWRYGPSRPTRWLGWSGWARNARTTPSRSDPRPGWCTCTRPKCSTTWWSCRGSRTRFDGYRRWMQPTRHPIIVSKSEIAQIS